MFSIQLKIHEIRKRIIQIRKEKGYSQENIAKMLQISQNAYYKIERGNTKLTLIRFLQIADILEIESTELITGPDIEFKFEQYYTEPKVIRVKNNINRRKETRTH